MKKTTLIFAVVALIISTNLFAQNRSSVRTDSLKNAKANAQYELAVKYTTGDGLTKNIDSALYWLNISAENNNAEAQFTLGLLYNGDGNLLDINMEKSFYWFKKSAENNLPKGQYNLAMLYSQGIGVAADDKQAVYWLKKAANNGHEKAKFKLEQMDDYGDAFKQPGESLILLWPESENWIIGDKQEDSEQHVVDLIHTNETIDNWTELGNMTTIKGVTGIPVEKVMNLMFEQTKQNAPEAKLTFIEKDENTEYPWIIFTIESPWFKTNNIPESQLWYIIQGKQDLYSNFIAIKKATISTELKEKWTDFFKTGKIVNE